MSQMSSPQAARNKITHTPFFHHKNHHPLQACFKFYYRKILSQISSLVNLNKAIIQLGSVCYDREAEGK